MKDFYNKVGTNEIYTGQGDYVGTVEDIYIKTVLKALNNNKEYLLPNQQHKITEQRNRYR